MSESPLYRKRTIALWYQAPVGAVRDSVEWMDFATGEWTPAGLGEQGKIKFVTFMMSSAIIGKSGSDTGELIAAYPLTSVHSIETSPEVMKMQLRVHMGAAIYRPENVQVLPDVHFEGLVGQEEALPGARIQIDTEKPIKLLVNAVSGRDAPSGCQEIGPVRPNGFQGDAPGMAYRGAIRYKRGAAGAGGADAGEWVYVKNNGHLGDLDSPSGYSKIRGYNIFSRETITVNTQSC